MKKIIALILAAICLLSLAACSGEPEAPASNRLETTASQLKTNLPDKLDLSDLDVLTDEDAFAENLMFVYGIDEDIRATIDSYFITNCHRSTDPRSIVVLFFKEDGNVKENIANAKKGIEDVYLTTLKNATATYDPEAAKIANAASFKVYDNALIFASYDTDGNTAVFDAVEGK